MKADQKKTTQTASPHCKETTNPDGRKEESEKRRQMREIEIERDSTE
jgi:hypothetical protein